MAYDDWDTFVPDMVVSEPMRSTVRRALVGELRKLARMYMSELEQRDFTDPREITAMQDMVKEMQNQLHGISHVCGYDSEGNPPGETNPFPECDE